MNHPFRKLAIVGTLLVAAPLFGRSPEPKPVETVTLAPLPEEKTAPWGKEVDGLSLRLVVPAEVTHGQPIRAVIEIRNTSKRTRHVYDHFVLPPKLLTALSAVDPTGKRIPKTNLHGVSRIEENGSDPRLFTALAPGETRRLELADLRDLFAPLVEKDGQWLPLNGFRKDGKYTLSYTFDSPRMAARYETGSRNQDDGKVEPVYTEPTKEQRAGVFEGTLRAAPVTIAMRPMVTDDLTVHEWGVFSVYADVKWANLNHKQEWATFPADFYRQFPTRRLLWRPAAVRKPIVYFYTKQPSLEIDLKVTFSAGAPVVWWPACAAPTDVFPAARLGAANPPGPPPPRKVFNSLQWAGWLGDVMPIDYKQWTKVEDFKLPPHAWLQDARLPQTARFTVQGIGPEGGYRTETERFIYYDGLVPAPDSLRCTAVTDADVTVKNIGEFPVAHLFFVDRRPVRAAKDWAVAYRAEPIPAGSEARIPLQAVRPAKDSAELKNLAVTVRKALLGTGLYEAEADSILKIWRNEFFESDGLTAFWLLPQTEYDRMLPLEVAPTPANRPVRTGIIHQPHFEMGPRVREHVAQLIRQLDSKAFRERDAANRQMEALGPWVLPHVREALEKKLSLETRRRLESLLQRGDASEWLKQTVPDPKEPAK